MVFFFVLNQCDKLEPIREWNVDEHKPSANQLENIERKREDVANHFNVAPSKVIAVSANEKYHLVELINEIVYALPKEKKLNIVQNTDPENVSDKAKDEAERGFWDTVKEAFGDVFEKGRELWDDFVFELRYNGGDILRDIANGVKKLFHWTL